MTVPNNTYEALHRLLATQGIVIIHKGGVPVNPANLFDMLMGQSQGRSVTVEVDDTFIEKMRNLAGDSLS